MVSRLMGAKGHEWSPPLSSPTFTTTSGIIVNTDALSFLRSIPPLTADVIFLDPPFNIGKSYGRRGPKRDKREEAEYMQFIRHVLYECIRVLADGGALFLYHLPQWALRFGEILDVHLTFRHWIAVSMKNGYPKANFLYPAHYALLYFTKGTPKAFKRPKIKPEKCRHCGELIHDYGGYIDFVRKGVNLSDIWNDLSPVRHQTTKTRNANELPLELARRIVRISSVRAGVLVDPFVGSGPSLLAATEAHMSYLASDREISYCRLASSRVKKYLMTKHQIKK